MNNPNREIIDRIVGRLPLVINDKSPNLTYSIDYKCLATALNLALENDEMPEGDWITEFYLSIDTLIHIQGRRFSPETVMLKTLRLVSGLADQVAEAGLTEIETVLLRHAAAAVLRIAKRRVPCSMVINWCSTQLLLAKTLEFDQSTHAEIIRRTSGLLDYRAQQLRCAERLARENEFVCENYVLSPDAAAILLENVKYNTLPFGDLPFGDLYEPHERAKALSDIAAVLSEVEIDFVEFRRSRHGNVRRVINILQRASEWRGNGYELTLGRGAKCVYEGFILAKQSNDALAVVLRRVRGI